METAGTLDYGRKPKQWLTHRRVIAALLIVGILLGVYAGYRWGVPWARWKWHQYQEWSCAIYGIDAKTIAYTEDPGKLSELDRSRAYHSVTLPTGYAKGLDIPKCYRDLWAWATVTPMISSDQSLLFLFGRKTAAGDPVIVIVTYQRIAAGITPPVSGFDTTVIVRSSGKVLPMIGPNFETTLRQSGSAPRVITFWAGQPDPVDESRFSIEYEISGRKGTLQFQVVDTVAPGVTPYKRVCCSSWKDFEN